MNFFNNIDLNKNELRNALMHPALTAPSDPKPGQMYFNTSDNKLYYYDGAKVNPKWVALNEIDISGKLDKVINATDHDQVYIKQAAGGQSMQDIASTATGNTLALRGSDGRLKVVAALANDEAVTLLQLNKGLEAADKAHEHIDNKVTTIGDSSDIQYPTTGAVVKYVKVKDVTLDGTSIVDTTTGVVALESTFHINLIGTSGTLKSGEYDSLNGDDASYIWYKTEEIATPVRVPKKLSPSGGLSYQTVYGKTIVSITINATGA